MKQEGCRWCKPRSSFGTLHGSGTGPPSTNLACTCQVGGQVSGTELSTSAGTSSPSPLSRGSTGSLDFEKSLAEGKQEHGS